MFLTVEWAKRWLPAVFLLLSLFLPWWTRIGTWNDPTFELKQDETYVVVVRIEWNPNLEPIKFNHDAVVAELKREAARTQKPVITYLEQKGVKILNTFWLTNLILIEADANTMLDIVALPTVASVFPNFPIFIIDGTENRTTYESYESETVRFIDLSFLWVDDAKLYYYPDINFSGSGYSSWSYKVLVYQIPYLCFISALIITAGLYGLIGNRRTRIRGGLLGIIGVLSYLIPIFNEFYGIYAVGWIPYFGTKQDTCVWFLSLGFYLALVGSLMLLSPIIRTGIVRIRKRPSSSKQTIKEPSFIDVK
jgi:hypothetical protein